MPKQKVKPQPNKKVQSSTNESFLKLDPKRVVTIEVHSKTSPEVKYPREYALIDSMKVGRSAIYPIDKSNVIDAIRRRIAILGNKKFLIRKVDQTHKRIWRVADNAVIRNGGRVKGVSPYKKAVIENVQPNNNSNEK